MHHFGFGDNHRENGNTDLQGLERNLVNNILEDRICNSRSWNAPPPCNQQNEFQFPNIYPPCDAQYYQPQQAPQSFDGSNYYRSMPIDPRYDNRPVGSNPSEYPRPPQTWQDMGPRTYTDSRGGEFTVDQGRMTQMRDDAGEISCSDTIIARSSSTTFATKVESGIAAGWRKLECLDKERHQ